MMAADFLAEAGMVRDRESNRPPMAIA